MLTQPSFLLEQFVQMSNMAKAQEMADDLLFSHQVLFVWIHNEVKS